MKVPPQYVIAADATPADRAPVLDRIQDDAITVFETIEDQLRTSGLLDAITSLLPLIEALEQPGFIKAVSLDGRLVLHSDVRERGPIALACYRLMTLLDPRAAREFRDAGAAVKAARAQRMRGGDA